jgi:hypothetical protein
VSQSWSEKEQNVSLAGANPRVVSHIRLRAGRNALNALRICVFSSFGSTVHQLHAGHLQRRNGAFF